MLAVTCACEGSLRIDLGAILRTLQIRLEPDDAHIFLRRFFSERTNFLRQGIPAAVVTCWLYPGRLLHMGFTEFDNWQCSLHAATVIVVRRYTVAMWLIFVGHVNALENSSAAMASSLDPPRAPVQYRVCGSSQCGLLDNVQRNRTLVHSNSPSTACAGLQLGKSLAVWLDSMASFLTFHGPVPAATAPSTSSTPTLPIEHIWFTLKEGTRRRPPRHSWCRFVSGALARKQGVPRQVPTKLHIDWHS